MNLIDNLTIFKFKKNLAFKSLNHPYNIYNINISMTRHSCRSVPISRYQWSPFQPSSFLRPFHRSKNLPCQMSAVLGHAVWWGRPCSRYYSCIHIAVLLYTVYTLLSIHYKYQLGSPSSGQNVKTI